MSEKFLAYNDADAADRIEMLQARGVRIVGMGPSDTWQLRDLCQVFGSQPGVRAAELLKAQARRRSR